MARPVFILLLTDREGFWARVRAREVPWVSVLGLIAFIVVACALYGAALAGWRSPRLALYVALKLPLLFLGTTTIVSVFNWMMAALLGSGLSFRDTVTVVFASMTLTAWILLSLLPAAIFFTVTGVADEGTANELQFAHNSILVTHVAILGLAGMGGNVALFRGLRQIVRPGCSPVSLLLLWVAAFGFVGCQLSWIFRPFVGSPFFPVAFMRADALDRNFYEFVFMEVIPFLLTGGK